jgi:hypothetical protein
MTLVTTFSLNHRVLSVVIGLASRSHTVFTNQIWYPSEAVSTVELCLNQKKKIRIDYGSNSRPLGWQTNALTTTPGSLLIVWGAKKWFGNTWTALLSLTPNFSEWASFQCLWFFRPNIKKTLNYCRTIECKSDFTYNELLSFGRKKPWFYLNKHVY